MKPLREIFRAHCEMINGVHVNGTDKQSNHSYGDAYDALLDRENIHLMLEVGVADGSSLLAWREALPNATVVGMDIHPANKWDGEFHLGNQTSLEDCARAANSRQFDLIVEDATHQLADTLVTLLYLWPYVAPGGMYIIEEFANIGALKQNVIDLLCADIIDVPSPFGGTEHIVVLRKYL